jgi:hypothetical protein
MVPLHIHIVVKVFLETCLVGSQMMDIVDIAIQVGSARDGQSFVLKI